jgi:hypothetical protein
MLRFIVPGTTAGVAQITVITEEETGRGWRYRIKVVRDSGETSEHDVGLSWADHEHWCGGASAPSRVVEAVVRYLVDREAQRAVPARFDASTARRWWPDLDRELGL